MIKSARVQSEISRRASGAERNVVMLSGTIPSVSGCISKMKLPSSSATAWNRRPREQNANSPPARTNSFESGCNFEQPGFGRGRGERGCANRADPKGYESPKGGQSPVFWPDISSGSLRVSLPERRRGRGGDRPTGRWETRRKGWMWTVRADEDGTIERTRPARIEERSTNHQLILIFLVIFSGQRHNMWTLSYY